MFARLVKPVHPALAGLVESFLFLDAGAASGSYTTFPNTNLCLALYSSSAVAWDRTENRCSVVTADHWSSCLFGFHRKPFTVRWQGPVQQVNILFAPGALSRFTDVPIHVLEMTGEPFLQLFGTRAATFIDRLFCARDAHAMALLLEEFLIAHLMPRSERALPVMAAIHNWRTAIEHGPIVEAAAMQARRAPSSVYRAFMDVVGQAPKAFFSTIRFRRSLAALLHDDLNATAVGLDNGYFDQPHFTRDMRRFSGETPGRLRRTVQVVQQEFVWVPR